MTKIYRIYQVDSFTNELFTGNPAGVVPNADGLTELQMQKIARELNNSETAFIFQPEEKGYDVWVRFFSPTMEVPLCGHATIAAHYIRAYENKMETCRIYQKTGAGILPVDIIKEETGYKIIMTQGKIVFEKPFGEETSSAISNALGLTAEELDERCPMQIVSAGHSKVMIGIKTQKKLDALKPDMKALAGLSREIKCNGYFVFTFNTNEDGILTKGRMFAPAIGINEDPVTGNANGPLGAYIVKHNLCGFNGRTFSFKGKQGEAIGRAGTIEVEVDIEEGLPVEVRVGGRGIIVFKTEINI